MVRALIHADVDPRAPEQLDVGAFIEGFLVVGDDPNGNPALLGIEDGSGDPIVGDREDADIDALLGPCKELDDPAVAIVAWAKMRLGGIGAPSRLDPWLDGFDYGFEPVEDALILGTVQGPTHQLECPMPRRIPGVVVPSGFEGRGECLSFTPREPLRLQGSDQEVLDLLGCHDGFR